MKTRFRFLHTITLLLIGWLLLNRPAAAQGTYNLVGTAHTSPASDCYQLTDNKPQQNGALWYDKPLRLTESFALEFTFNFGSNTDGADGMMMVMQTVGNRILGTPGSGIGFQGLRPSLGIEFDTFQNTNLDDPIEDHIAIVRDGVSDHRLNSFFAAPVPISATSNTVRDGKDHLIRVKWTVGTRLLQVQVDCMPRISQTIDLINDIFNGYKEVYWGFTSSTGGAYNAHTVCIQQDVIIRDTIQACKLEQVALISSISSNGQYNWQPATGLSNSRIRSPRLKVTTDKLYTVTYLDRCSLPKTDTVFVKVKPLPTLSLGGNRQVCENQVVNLTPMLTPATIPVKFRWSTGDSTRQLTPTASGLYRLQITADGCSVSDSALLTFTPPPKLGLTGEPTYNCPLDRPILLNPKASGTGLSYSWTPGGTSDSTLSVSAAGRYNVKVSTKVGCSVEQGFTILDNCLPSASVFIPNTFTPNGDGLNELFEWKSSTDIDARMKIFNRWGEVIFSSDNSSQFWNGTWQGHPCPSTMYAWRLEFRSRQSTTNQWFVKLGEVLLLR